MAETEAPRHQLTGAAAITCDFCERPAVAPCAHRLSEPWIIYPHEVRVADMIEHSLDLEFYRCVGIRPPRPEIVTDAEDLPPEPYILLLAIRSGEIREQSHRTTIPLLRRESRKCGRPACDRHLRDQGDEHYQCAAHWEDWKVYSPDA